MRLTLSDAIGALIDTRQVNVLDLTEVEEELLLSGRQRQPQPTVDPLAQRLRPGGGVWLRRRRRAVVQQRECVAEVDRGSAEAPHDHDRPEPGHHPAPDGERDHGALRRNRGAMGGTVMRRSITRQPR